MLGVLVESNPPRRRRRGGMAISAAAHAAVILLAVRATAGGEDRRVAQPVDPDPWPAPTYLTPPPDRARHSLHHAASGAEPGPAPLPRAPVLPAMPDLAIPSDLPPVAATLGNPFAGPVADRLPAGLRAGDGAGSGIRTGVLEARYADKPAYPLEGNAPPRYPDELRAAGIVGIVEVEFVIETSGRVRPGSIVALRADHPRFLDAVRAALGENRYLPAEARGAPVAVRVRQRFAFTLER